MRGILVRYAAAAALATGLMLGQAPVENQPPQPGQRFANRLNQVAQVLELTPDQRTQMQAIIQQGMQAARPIMQQLRQNKLEMRQLIESGATGPQFDQQLQQFASTQGQLVGQLAGIKARGMAQFYSMLNPQQRQRATALSNLMGGHHRHGHHGGWD
jgi:Spy/CpxP family protein refolding chaperone